MDLTDINVIKKLMSRYRASFSKALGQNFLVNPAICPEMARLCGADKSCGVIEIGPGIGVLTRCLAEVSGKVTAIELDARLMPVLAETLAGLNNVEVINADVMKTDLHALIKNSFPGQRVFVCANLPYYITSPVIMRLLETHLPVENITVMVQKEAATRICARVGSREAGALTAAVNFYAEAQKLFDVDKSSFFPSPKVNSSVISLKLRKSPAVSVKDEAFFFSVIRSAFAQRRKTASNSLSAGLKLPKDTVESAVLSCGLKPTDRAESFSLESFARLSDILFEQR